MQFNNRGVKRIIMHDTIHTAETGLLPLTIATNSQESKLQGVKLSYVDGSVIMELKGWTHIIPATNCKIISLEKDIKADTAKVGVLDATAVAANLQGTTGTNAVNPHLAALNKATSAAKPTDAKV